MNGRTIDYRYLDDGYNPTQTVTTVKQLVLQDKVFAHTKVVDFLNRCWGTFGNAALA